MSDQPSVDELKTGAARLIRQAALVDGEWIAAAGANVIEVVDRIKALLPTLRETLPNSLDITVLTDRTLMRRYSGQEAWRGTLAEELSTLLGAAGWRPSRPCPQMLQR